MCVELSARTWSACQGHILLGYWLFFSQHPSAVTSFLNSMKGLDTFLNSCWNIDYICLLQILYRQPYLLWVPKFNRPLVSRRHYFDKILPIVIIFQPSLLQCSLSLKGKRDVYCKGCLKEPYGNITQELMFLIEAAVSQIKSAAPRMK